MTPVQRFSVVAVAPAVTHQIGVAIGEELIAGDLVVLSGQLGAGKTTLTRGIGTGLNVRGPVTSPTFVISRIHPPLDQGPALVHVDAYRLAGAAVIDDLDLDSRGDDAVLVVEWGQGRVEHLADSWLLIELDRSVTNETVGAGRANDVCESRTVHLACTGDAWSPQRFAALRSKVTAAT